jgi:hypothetical protein
MSEPLNDWPERPPQPYLVFTRAHTMLRMVRLGIVQMESGDHDNRTFGLMAVAVFGRALTNVVQNLRTFDEAAFNEWYAPWEKEMRGDPLSRYFYGLRTDVLKGITPSISVVLASFGTKPDGTPVEPVGALLTRERPFPTVHLGQPIDPPTAEHLCRLYFEYLERMVASFDVVVWEVQDRFHAAQSS